MCDYESTSSTSMKRYDKEKMMIINRDDEEIMIIKREIMNVFKWIDEEINNAEKLLCCDDVKFKKVLKNIFDFCFRNSNS